jgi:hypothetical protein
LGCKNDARFCEELLLVTVVALEARLADIKPEKIVAGVGGSFFSQLFLDPMRNLA